MLRINDNDLRTIVHMQKVIKESLMYRLAIPPALLNGIGDIDSLYGVPVLNCNYKPETLKELIER